MPCRPTTSRRITLSVAAGLVTFVGCQKLPPGVLAGSRSTTDTSVRTVAANMRVDALADAASPESSDAVETLRRELEETRAEQTRLRELLARSVEQTMAAQAELVDLYRERALAAESRIASMEREIAASRVAEGETESVTR